MSKLILVTGTPGTGKTTVARLLGKAMGIPVVNLADLVKGEKLYVDYDKDADSYVVDVAGVRKRLEEISRREDRVIVESHIIEAVPSDILDLCVVLRLDPRVLRERLKERGYPPRKIYENVQSEILDVVLIEALRAYGQDRVFEVDTTGRSPSDVTKIAMNIIRSRKDFRPGSVDWISKLGEEVYEFLEG